METKKKNPAAVAMGKLGGKANFAKHGREQMIERGKMGADARWGKDRENE